MISNGGYKDDSDDPGDVDRDKKIDEVVSDLSEQDVAIVLDSTLKAQFERAFDFDLSEVRIHTGAFADDLAKQNKADAVTVEHDIYFARGKYSPDTDAGINLLAHELQHFIQKKNKMRLEYDEEIREAEHEASNVELAMNELQLHKIGSLQGENPLQALSATKGNVENERSIKHKAVIVIKLRDGTTAILTPPELERLYQEFKQKVILWISEKRSEKTDEDLFGYYLKLMRIV